MKKELNPENLKQELYLYYPQDGSHGLNHLDDVFNLAIRINDKLNLNVDTEEIIISSYCHDMFSVSDREIHHKKAAEYIMNNRELWFLKDRDNDQIIRIAKAVEQHRASFKGEFHSPLAELINAADKGEIDIVKTIIRSFRYNMEINKEEKINTLINNVYNHMKEKFSSHGYLKYNSTYQSMFGAEIIKFQNYFDTVSKVEVEDIIFGWLKNISFNELKQKL